MAWTKMKTAIVASAVVLLAAGTTTVTIKEIQAHRTYPWQTRQYDYRLLDKAPPQLAILPSKYSANGGFGSSLGGIMGVGEPATCVVEAAYDWYHIPRIALDAQLPRGSYDFIGSGAANSKALKDEVKRKFGVTAKIETRETDVWLLTVKSSNALGLGPNTNPDGQSHISRGDIALVNSTPANFAYLLENMVRNLPIIDRTGLADNPDFDKEPVIGNKPKVTLRQTPKQGFDINLKWDDGTEGQPHNIDNLKQALLDQLGLELVSTNMPVEMLVVEKAK